MKNLLLKCVQLMDDGVDILGVAFVKFLLMISWFLLCDKVAENDIELKLDLVAVVILLQTSAMILYWMMSAVDDDVLTVWCENIS